MTRPSESDAAEMRWQAWSAEAFALAAERRQPVLLSIGASWCHGCAVMDQTTYARPEIVAVINARTVPVRVDADRRPDINDRYNLDGWPTTALLTHTGEILTGSTYVTPEVMTRMLAEAGDALRDRYDEIMARAATVAASRHAPVPAPRYEVDMESPDWVAARLLAEQDPEFGGFGTGGKFLHPAALRFALASGAVTGNEALTALVSRTLDGMARGAIHDGVDGGTFRYAAGRDWSRPHTEKMLEEQAAMVVVLLEAADLLGRPALVEQARSTIAYVQRTLADRDRGAFFASQRADDEYYGVSASIRQTLDAPPVDRTLFVDANAQAAAAWLHAGGTLDDVSLGRFALRALETVLLQTYRPGEGVAHYVDPGAEVRGLLTDHVHAALALVDAHDATDNDTYGMLAEELMRTAIRTMWDREAGGFLDRVPGGPDDVGRLADPVKPLALNCLAARVLGRLAARTGREDLAQYARAALASQTGAYRAQGVGGAPYALAVLELYGGEER